jgi:hypothetical protein
VPMSSCDCASLLPANPTIPWSTSSTAAHRHHWCWWMLSTSPEAPIVLWWLPPAISRVGAATVLKIIELSGDDRVCNFEENFFFDKKFL